MLSPEEETLVPEELVLEVSDIKERRPVPLSAVLVVCVVVAIGISLHKPESTYAEAGTTVTDRWQSWAHRLALQPPGFRRVEYSDDHIEFGALVDGERRGRWTRKQNGIVTYKEF